MKSIILVTLVALGCVVFASLCLSVTAPGRSMEFFGLHIAEADLRFIPPAAGAIAIVGGIILLIVKSKRTG